MGDEIWAVFKRIERERKAKRRARLEATDTTGWTKLSDTHFRLRLDDDSYIDWWPSANKWLFRNQRTKFERWYKGGLSKDLKFKVDLILHPIQEM